MQSTNIIANHFSPISHASQFQQKLRARILSNQQPVNILIANAKGGCGKTTVATNLASYFASNQLSTTLIDYDPQASSSQWVQARHSDKPNIHHIEAFTKRSDLMTRSWQIKNLPRNTQRVIFDTPAGLHGQLLNDLVDRAHIILVPVTPSAIDIRATTKFIKELLLCSATRNNIKAIAVLANRAKKNTIVYSKLELFLQTLKIPFVTSLRDTQYYVRASEYGLGIHDLQTKHKNDVKEWELLINWLEEKILEIDF